MGIKGGIGIFYKESLTLKIRHDLSFECIVTELIFGHKKIFFTVLYRTLSIMSMLLNLKTLFKILKKINAHALNW